jgi:hypothetical protein
MAAAGSAQDWTTTIVEPPPDACCATNWSSDDDCDVLQNAVDAAAEYTILSLQPGLYCNKNWYKNIDSNTSLRN